MPKPRSRRPVGRFDDAPAPDLWLEEELDDPVDLDAVYEESLLEVDPEWLDRYGEADWYAAITLFGLFTVTPETRLEDIPEEYRWRGTSRRWPTGAGGEAASTDAP